VLSRGSAGVPPLNIIYASLTQTIYHTILTNCNYYAADLKKSVTGLFYPSLGSSVRLSFSWVTKDVEKPKLL